MRRVRCPTPYTNWGVLLSSTEHAQFSLEEALALVRFINSELPLLIGHIHTG